MTTEQFLGVFRRRPFRPFSVRTASGEQHPVEHPEQAMTSASGRTVAIFLPDEVTAIIDVAEITEYVAARSRSKAPKPENGS